MHLPLWRVNSSGKNHFKDEFRDRWSMYVVLKPVVVVESGESMDALRCLLNRCILIHGCHFNIRSMLITLDVMYLPSCTDFQDSVDFPFYTSCHSPTVTTKWGTFSKIPLHINGQKLYLKKGSRWKMCQEVCRVRVDLLDSKV